MSDNEPDLLTILAARCEQMGRPLVKENWGSLTTACPDSVVVDEVLAWLVAERAALVAERDELDEENQRHMLMLIDEQELAKRLENERDSIIASRDRIAAALANLLSVLNLGGEMAIVYSHTIYGSDHTCKDCREATAVLAARESARAALETRDA